MKNQLYRDIYYSFFVKFILILFSFIFSLLLFTRMDNFHFLGEKSDILVFCLLLLLNIFLFTIYIFPLSNKNLDRLYLCYRFFKKYTKEEINLIYLDESIDIDLIYYQLIPYSKYKNDTTIDQHINIDRLLKQRRPLDMKLADISFSENYMAIL